MVKLHISEELESQMLVGSTAVRYQITDSGSSLEGDDRKGVCYQLVAVGSCN